MSKELVNYKHNKAVVIKRSPAGKLTDRTLKSNFAENLSSIQNLLKETEKIMGQSITGLTITLRSAGAEKVIRVPEDLLKSKVNE
ncbi:hypothetical protein [Bacillus swezeyi]|uniref:Uncharacterized protein n=1 Tax=Bacillus swezeyi TaxID=1925020 RepID=A0A5M8RFJ4_9BACI|nr:hypothetical protein [Bacillus swezeyi]KAA6446979.1 hypothetical protein DX927_23325 [Bacillus swezeyi]KAA6471547.1 hypothetical protein DX928_23565 [Bacillus swezeyi]